MFKTSHAVKTLSTPEEVWALVKDVGKWKNWLLGVEAVQINGPLESGGLGILYLGDGMVHQMYVQKYDLGYLEIFLSLRYRVKMHLVIDVSPEPRGSKVKLEGELVGAMSLLHLWGWGKNLKTGLIPTTRRLGVLSQEPSGY